MSMKKRRRMKVETRHITPPKGVQNEDLGGIYGDSEMYHLAQKDGQTNVPIEPQRAYHPDAHRRPPDMPHTDRARKEMRQIRMSTMDENGKPISLHYQREWQILNYKGLNHEVIHLAVQNVLERKGFLSHSSETQRQGGAKAAEMRDKQGMWSDGARYEEAIVDALEQSGIREGKITEQFWEFLEEQAQDQQVPLPDVTPELLGLIAQELEVLCSRNVDDETQQYPLP